MLVQKNFRVIIEPRRNDMKKSLIALAVLACAAGVASAGQAPPTNINTFQGGALMITGVSIASADGITKMNPGGGSSDVTGMKTINGGGSGGITSANGGGSSCLTAQAPPTHLGTGSTDPSDV
ncbi:MAG: hypothetical protein KBC50_02715 [Candidatus Pacebacteria bacterium]|nr:hypothetical protein [Candidatus Paceibacterota bacterium]